VVMNRSDLLGRYVNRRWANGAGALVVLVTLLLGGLKILRVLGVNL
jgi:hypothetical protein